MGAKKRPNHGEKVDTLSSLLGETTHPVYRTLKCPLKKLLKGEHRSKIEEAVRLCHRVGTLALDFVKLYVITRHTENQPIPELNEDFYKTVIRVVSTKPPKNGGRPLSQNRNLYDSLLNFHHQHFLTLSPHNARIQIENMSHIFAYMAAQFATVQTTNITRNFQLYIRRYVNKVVRGMYYAEKGWATDYTMSDDEKRVYFHEMKQIKDDIIWYRRWNGGYQCEPKYHDWLDGLVGRIYPEPLDPLHEWALFHDLHSNTSRYIPFLIRINQELEGNGAKLFSPLCLRSSMSARYIKIDTAALVDLVFDSDMVREFALIHDIKNLVSKGQMYDSLSKLMGKSVTKSESFDFNTKIWEFCMKFDSNSESRKFLRGTRYVFDNTILTDAVGMSVLQIRKDRVGKSCKENNKRDFRITPSDVPYLSSLTAEEATRLLSDTVVLGCDPGKNDIVYMVDKEGNRLRYTAQQRAIECRFKKNKRALVNMKHNLVCADGRTVEEVEHSIEYSAKSCRLENVRNYIQQRRELESLVVPAMYDRLTPRKLRLSAKLHTAKSEDRLLQKVANTFKDPNKPLGVTIAWGNWGRNPQMRNCFPTPGVGLRCRIAKKGKNLGIWVGLEKEQYSSCTCHTCHARTDYWKHRTYIKDAKVHTRAVHGLLRCQNETCSRLWNRNVNGALNILEIARATLNAEERPPHFTIAHAAHAAVHQGHG